MESCVDDTQLVIQTASLASTAKSTTMVTTTSLASSPQKSSESKDDASITAIKSPRTDWDESLSLTSNSPVSPFGKPLTNNVACHSSKPRPLSHLARIDHDQYLEQYLGQLWPLGETDLAGKCPPPPKKKRFGSVSFWRPCWG